MRNHVLISLVGTSPGAVIAPALGWGAHAGQSLKKVLLLAPGPSAIAVAKSLASVWSSRHQVPLELIELDLGDLMDGRTDLKQRVEKATGPDHAIVYLASPGLNTAVARTYLALHATGRLVDVLYNEPGGPLWSLTAEPPPTRPECESGSLGPDGIAQLLGRRVKTNPVAGDFPDRLSAAIGPAAAATVLAPASTPFRFSMPGGEQVDWAAERQGILFLLVVVTATNPDQGKAATRRLNRLAEFVRLHDQAYVRVLAVVEGTLHAIGAYSSDLSVAGRPMGDTMLLRMVRTWIDWPMRRVAAAPRPTGGHGSAAAAGNGEGSRDEALALFLGPDPSPTLISLYTHQPSRAVVLYDATDSIIQRRAALLREQASQLPVKELYLVPSDRLGSGAARAIEGLGVDAIDITPGSKAQTIQLLRTLRSGATLGHVWTLAAGKGQALTLDGARDARTLQGPPIAVLAASVLGSARPGGASAEEAGEALAAAAQILGAYVDGEASQNQNADIALPNWNRRQSTIRNREGQISRSEGRYHITTRARTDAQIAGRDGLDNWGALFELVVAHLLAWCNVFDEMASNLARGRELDLVARLGHRFFVLECGSGAIDHTKAARHVDKTYLQFGRFAIPVVVAPRFGRDSGGWRRLHPSCVFWDLSTFRSHATLKAAVHEALESRRGRLDTERDLPEADTANEDDEVIVSEGEPSSDP